MTTGKSKTGREQEYKKPRNYPKYASCFPLSFILCNLLGVRDILAKAKGTFRRSIDLKIANCYYTKRDQSAASASPGLNTQAMSRKKPKST